MSDIVERLREAAKEEYYAQYGGYDVIMIEAAAEIERLREELAKARPDFAQEGYVGQAKEDQP